MKGIKQQERQNAETRKAKDLAQCSQVLSEAREQRSRAQHDGSGLSSSLPTLPNGLLLDGNHRAVPDRFIPAALVGPDVPGFVAYAGPVVSTSSVPPVSIGSPFQWPLAPEQMAREASTHSLTTSMPREPLSLFMGAFPTTCATQSYSPAPGGMIPRPPSMRMASAAQGGVAAAVARERSQEVRTVPVRRHSVPHVDCSSAPGTPRSSVRPRFTSGTATPQLPSSYSAGFAHHWQPPSEVQEGRLSRSRHPSSQRASSCLRRPLEVPWNSSVVPSKTCTTSLGSAPKKPVTDPSLEGLPWAAGHMGLSSGRKGSVAPERGPAHHFDFIARPRRCSRQL